MLCLSPAPAAAHDRTTSYSSWDIRGREARVIVRVSELDISHFPWGVAGGDQRDRGLATYLPRRLQLVAGDSPCAVTERPHRLDAVPGRLVFEWRVACPPTGALRILSELLLDVSPTHMHFARVSVDGAPITERVLSERERIWTVASVSSGGADIAGMSVFGYLRLGIEHIATGYDHLAFLLALLLVEGSLGQVAKVVTGFTLAHSLTLALTLLGYARPDTGSIEALIGLSIALVAAENIWLASARSRLLPWLIAGGLACLSLAATRGHGRVPTLALAGLALFSICYFGLLERAARPTQLRWAIAFLFGLVHGFGFAGVLLEARLPPERLIHALFGFNAGVEVGQLAALALIWPVLRLAARPQRVQLRRAMVEFGSAAVLSLGLFWFVTRAYG